MANIDMSLDDIISKSGEGGGRTRSSGRRPAGSGSGVVRGGRPPRGGAERNARPSATGARRSAAPYQRSGGRKTGSGEDDHLQNASVADVAASSNPTLKVKSDSKPNTVAGAICNIVREARNNKPPSILATGPQAINQAIKAIAIARKYLLDEDTPIDLQVVPKFEQDIRSGSNVMFEMGKCRPIGREPEDNDLSAKEHTDAFKLAGAIAGRVRDGEEVAVTTKGAIPVLVAVKAIALAQDYVAEEGIHIKFAVQFRDLEDPEMRGSPTSTFLHFAIIS